FATAIEIRQGCPRFEFPVVTPWGDLKARVDIKRPATPLIPETIVECVTLARNITFVTRRRFQMNSRCRDLQGRRMVIDMDEGWKECAGCPSVLLQHLLNELLP